MPAHASFGERRSERFDCGVEFCQLPERELALEFLGCGQMCEDPAERKIGIVEVGCERGRRAIGVQPEPRDAGIDLHVHAERRFETAREACRIALVRAAAPHRNRRAALVSEPDFVRLDGAQDEDRRDDAGFA